jgi:thiamine biosynthesis lipoprotein
VGVEDPGGRPEPLLVLALSDEACTTSSIRLRRWTAGGTPVHHLIDPRTGLPGGHGLASVTVVGPDPAMAEVWSKTLFLSGRGRIEAETTRRSLAACWTTLDGTTDVSLAMESRVLWRRP